MAEQIYEICQFAEIAELILKEGFLRETVKRISDTIKHISEKLKEEA